MPVMRKNKVSIVFLAQMFLQLLSFITSAKSYVPLSIQL